MGENRNESKTVIYKGTREGRKVKRRERRQRERS
jgi:hypothetical protein